MVAAPYKISLTLSAQGKPNKVLSLTASDVNNEFWLGQDSASDLVLSAVSGGYIADILYTTTGTDTSQVAIFKNNVDTGVRIINAANGPTVLNRQGQSMKYPFSAGDKFRFKQLT